MFQETDRNRAASRDKTREWLAWTIIVALVVVSAITGISFPIPPPPAAIDAISQGVSGGVSSFTGLHVAAPTVVATATPALMVDSAGVSRLFEVRDAATPVFSVNNGGSVTRVGNDALTGNLTITGAASVSSNLTVTGVGILSTRARLTAQTVLTVTNGAAFTATGVYQGIIAGSEVTPTITAGTAGDLLIIVNTGTNVVNLADTGTAKLTAAFAMGQYDSLTLLADGTNWIEIARANN